MPPIDVLQWLLNADPSLRWQVLRDLTDASVDEITQTRARVATEGHGAALLALQAPDGRWGGAAWNHGWTSTMHALSLLRDLGLDPAAAVTQRALTRVRDKVTWRGCGPPEADENSFFAGETEPCINAQVAAAGAYFGEDVTAIVQRLLAEQLPDGGWNCEAERGATRSSFNTTIGVLEALLEYERVTPNHAAATEARLRGQNYLLQRALMRRLSTGETILRDRKSSASWHQFAFPTWWHYDVLRGLDYLRAAGVAPDVRLADALALVVSKRTEHGIWLMEARHEGPMLVEVDVAPGEPSRWITLRALRVLRWFGAART